MAAVLRRGPKHRLRPRYETHGIRFFSTDANRLAAGAGIVALRAVLRAAVRRDGGMSFFSSNPVTNPNAFLTTRHYDASSSIRRHLPRRAVVDPAHRADHHGRVAADRLSAGALDGAHAVAPRPRLVLMAVIAPMLTGIVVRTFAWMTILQDKGVINTLLIQWGVIEKPLPLMYNESARSWRWSISTCRSWC